MNIPWVTFTVLIVLTSSIYGAQEHAENQLDMEKKSVSCQDSRFANCDWMVKAGWCNGWTESIMRRTCPKSCGMCPKPTKPIRPKPNVMCGFNKYGVATDKIVGGQEARPNEFPWLVPIYFKLTETRMVQGCGAAIINSQYLVTAAHCFVGNTLVKTPSDVFVALRAHHKYELRRPDVLAVENIIIHANYLQNQRMVNDIALIKLAKPLESLPANDMSVNSICLPEASDDFTHKNCMAAGWGDIKQGGQDAMKLKKVNLPVVGWRKCRKQYQQYSNNVALQESITNKGFCAYSKEEDTCQGDSGGPFMCKKNDGRVYLAGVVSFGEGCAKTNLPGVYVDVTKYLAWIHQQMASN